MSEKKILSKQQVGQMIRHAFEKRMNGQMDQMNQSEIATKPPILNELKDGQQVDVDLYPAQVAPRDPSKHERRRYIRQGNRLFFYVLQEVK